MARYTWFLLLSLCFFGSCGTWRHFKTSDFAEIGVPNELDGVYLNRTYASQKKDTLYYSLENFASILSMFNISKYDTRKKFQYTDYVTLKYEEPNLLRLTFYSDTIEQSLVFEGEMKKNFFEIYFKKNQFFIPLIYSSIDIDRIRVGKSKDGNLLIRSFHDQSGNLLLFAGGIGGEVAHQFGRMDLSNAPHPYMDGSKWGYTDMKGTVFIAPEYDFAGVFEQGVARVKLEGKWGLINKNGEVIVHPEYDDMTPFNSVTEPLIAKVWNEGKQGLINIDGVELIPAIYDKIDNYVRDGFLLIQKDGYKGVACRSGVVIPALYDNISIGYSSKGFMIGTRDGVNYYLDSDGYEYDMKKADFWGISSPDLNTKRKIGNFQTSVHD